MNILLLCNKLPYPTNDGSSIAIARLIEGYVEQGINLTVLSLNTKKHFKDAGSIPGPIAQAVNFQIIDVDTDPTARNAFLNLFQKLPFHVSRFYQKSVAAKLEQILKEQQFDIVQFEGIFMMPYKLMVKEISTAKIVLRAHNVEHMIWQRAIEMQAKPVMRAFLRAQSKKLKRYEVHCSKVADAILPISPIDADFFKPLNKNVHTVPCGIDKILPIEKVDNSSFFHLGAMDWLPNQQGVDWLLKEVWPKVFQENDKLTLHLAGRAMSKELLDLNVPGVKVHGEIDDAIAFRKNSGIMLVPLLAGSGMRIKIIDGLAQGLPIISTVIGAEGISVSHNKSALLADDAHGFARHMLRFASDEQECIAFGKNAATLAQETYLNHQIVANLVDFYRTTWQLT